MQTFAVRYPGERTWRLTALPPCRPLTAPVPPGHGAGAPVPAVRVVPAAPARLVDIRV